ncbi:MAG: hypothetical protein DWQ41_01140 [Planctomycetota bacterium]|nr:MAG: hypothetical protein DWQ41_01140 [Planctomycetota bacterium]
MVKITVSADAAAAIRSSSEMVALHDESGNCLGYVTPPLSDAEQAAIRRRLESDGPWYTTAEVLDHLKSLDTE